MAQSWVLTDVENSVWNDSWDLPATAANLGNQKLSVTKRTLQGGRRQGVETLRVELGSVAVELLLSRGMGIWKAWCEGESFGWDSPAHGPVHPQFVPLMEPGGLGWLDGFDELLVRCGLQSNGAPEHDDEGKLVYPLHGRIANLPAHYVSVEIDEREQAVSIIGKVRESRFHFQKLELTSRTTLKAGQLAIEISDQVENLSASPAEVQLLYHINFGTPLLDAGSQFVAPVKNVVPRNAHAASGMSQWNHYGAPQAGFEEQVYFMDMAEQRAAVMLKNAHATRGAGIHYNTAELPCFTLWKNTTDLVDGYVTGLEPGTNYPNPRSFEGEQQRFRSLDGHRSCSFQLKLEFLMNESSVAAWEEQIRQVAPAPKLHPQPLATWCEGAPS